MEPAALSQPLSLSAQTAYAEAYEQSQATELAGLSIYRGTFHERTIKGHRYVYFGYRDPLGDRQRRIYIGPASERIRKIIEKLSDRQPLHRLVPSARAAIELGCAHTMPKHFRIIQQIASYGFFRAGGVLLGTHAFVVMGNMLGVRWINAAATLDVDFAHAGRNISIALPTDVQLSVHDALTSLEMGLLPAVDLSGAISGQYRNPSDPELRVDFLTPQLRQKQGPILVKELGVALEPIKFMEYPLEGVAHCAAISSAGACVVNIPSPHRFAVHKLIVSAERDIAHRTKALKDVDQAAALIDWAHRYNAEPDFNEAWRDALERGPGWRRRATRGQKALLAKYPQLRLPRLWRT